MKTLTLLVCSAMFLTACGSAGPGSTGNNVTMQAGQWEYAVIPDNNSTPMFIDINQPSASSSLVASNAVIFNAAEISFPGAKEPFYCEQFNLNANISDNTLKGKMSWGQPSVHFAKISGTVDPNGQSLSNGLYSGQLCTDGTGPGTPSSNINGSMTGYTISPVNGTFTGTLNSTVNGPIVVTLSLTQDSDFSVNIAGTFLEKGVTSLFVPSTISPSGLVRGATLSIGGSSKNINGIETISLSGHLNPSATQIVISVMNIGSDGTITGSLTKQ
jgi:hypothetical protein